MYTLEINILGFSIALQTTAFNLRTSLKKNSE
jgi:hypothetical protein